MKKYIVITLVLVALWFAREPILAYSLSREVDFTVTRAERVNYGDISKYLVWSSDQGVFQNTDTVWFWKWNSSDVQGKMLPGAKIHAKVTGLRFGFFSWYPNIITAEITQ